jgi:hypothetical protein
MIRLAQWSAEVERNLQISAGRDLPEIKAQVLSGVAQLWECESVQSHAWCVTRLDRDSARTEWVIVLLEGSGLHEFVPFFTQAAEEKGLEMRVHLDARRPGLERMAKRHGFFTTELVMRRG